VLTGKIGVAMDVDWFSKGWLPWSLCIILSVLDKNLMPDIVKLEKYWDDHAN
jgi:hypothetical protein